MLKSIRYILFKENNQWIACSLEFGLAVQSDNIKESENKLFNQILEFINSTELLDRKAIPSVYLKYYLNLIFDLFRNRNKVSRRIRCQI